MKYTLLSSLVAMTLPLAVYAHDDHDHHHEQHEAHEHGAAQLNVVQEKHELMMELKLSAMDVVGFEHAPSNAVQKAAIEKAESLLADANKVFMPSRAAECKVESAKAEREALGHEEHDKHEDEHKHGHEHEEKHHKAHGHDEHEEHEHEKQGEETHSEFHVRYGFHCEHPDKLKQVEVKLFSVFSTLEKMQVQVVTEKGQTASQLTAKQSTIALP